MNVTLNVLGQFESAVATATPEELPRLIGALEAAKAAAWARLTAPAPTNGNGSEAEDRLLAMPAVAERLGITEHQAREMGRRGELPVVTVGERGVRVSAHALAHWIAARESGSLPRSRRGR